MSLSFIPCCSDCGADVRPPAEEVCALPLQPLSDDEDGSPASPALTSRSRLEALTNMFPEESLVRSITLRKSLQQFGVLWRLPSAQSPQMVNFYDWSEPAQGYDYFLSHAWRTSGWLKYFSLLLYSSHLFLLILMLVLASLVYAICMLDLLPTFGYVRLVALDWTCLESELNPGCPTGPWVIGGGFLAVVSGLFIAPHLPSFCASSDVCFVDAACIHQADPEKKQAGIDAIAGFLSKSRQLRILWSPPYFSRLWCVFEIAAYRKVNPRGGLALAPMFVERTVLLIVFGAFIMAGFFWIVDANNYDPRVKGVCVAINPLILLVHLLRSNACDKTTLLQDLERFDLESVHCSLEADREFVMAAIDHWYGSPKAFTEYVRGPLRQELLNSATKISTTYIFLMTAPAILAALEEHLALWKARVPVRTAAAHFVAVVLGDYTLWMSFCLRMLISLCFYFDAKCRWKIIDYLLTIVIHVIFCSTAFAGELIGAEASRRGLWTACAFMVFAGALLGMTRLTSGVCRV